jgi:hypothetical protein
LGDCANKVTAAKRPNTPNTIKRFIFIPPAE